VNHWGFFAMDGDVLR